jgi:hypothetical protein
LPDCSIADARFVAERGPLPAGYRHRGCHGSQLHRQRRTRLRES